jgi:hypothetical protein
MAEKLLEFKFPASFDCYGGSGSAYYGLAASSNNVNAPRLFTVIHPKKLFYFKSVLNYYHQRGAYYNWWA